MAGGIDFDLECRAGLERRGGHIERADGIAWRCRAAGEQKQIRDAAAAADEAACADADIAAEEIVEQGRAADDRGVASIAGGIAGQVCGAGMEGDERVASAARERAGVIVAGGIVVKTTLASLPPKLMFPVM